jgi:hypothetical protein
MTLECGVKSVMVLKAKARGSPNRLGCRGKAGQGRANPRIDVSNPMQEIQTQAYASLGMANPATALATGGDVRPCDR